MTILRSIRNPALCPTELQARVIVLEHDVFKDRGELGFLFQLVKEGFNLICGFAFFGFGVLVSILYCSLK